MIVDLAGLLCIEGSASGFNRAGCNIIANRVDELSEVIGLRVDGLEKMIRGRITEIADGEAKVAFEFSDPDKDREKRRERRRPVHISALVSDMSARTWFHCIITNASQNGCRLDGEGVSHMPDDIYLRINGLDLPVRGNIAWRGTACAGVRLLWQFSTGKDMSPMFKNGAPGSGRKANNGRIDEQMDGPSSEKGSTAGNGSQSATTDRTDEKELREQRRLEMRPNRSGASAFQPRKKNA